MGHPSRPGRIAVERLRRRRTARAERRRDARRRRTTEIRVVGHLDDRWATWFAGFAIARYDDGTCTLTGAVADQAQLHGILARLRDIGATLLAVGRVDDVERISGCR